MLTCHHLLRRFFQIYAKILCNYTIIFISVPLILTATLSMGFFNMSPEKRAYNITASYTPTNSRSIREFNAFSQLWPLNRWKFTAETSIPGSNNFLYLIFTTKQSPDQVKPNNILDNDYLDEIYDILDYISTNLSSTSHDGNRQYYKDSCLGYGSCLVPTQSLLPLLQKRQELDELGLPLTFPIFNKGGSPINLAPSLGGVRTTPEGQLVAAEALRAFFFLQLGGEGGAVAANWLRAVDKYLLANFLHNDTSDLVDVVWFHSRSIDFGMTDQVDVILPKVSVTFLVLSIFATLVAIRFRQSAEGSCVPIIDTVRSKTLWAGAGVVTAFMGVASGIGLPLILGFYYSESNSVIPFLIVSIGVDDMFILTAAWHHSRMQICKGGSVEERVSRRMSATLSEAAVSITITSLTDALSFAVGAISNIRAVQLFCRDAALAVCFNYAYQITFYAAIMVIGGRQEERGQNSFCPCCSSPKAAPQAVLGNGKAKLERLTSVTSITATQRRHIIRAIYTNTFFKLATILLYIIYISGAIYGAVNVKEGMRYEKLLLASNPFPEMLKVDVKYFTSSVECQVLVKDPPELSLPDNRRRMMEIVERFEASPKVVAHASNVWIRAYLEYLNATGSYVQDSRSQWTDSVYDWSRAFAFRQLWERDLAWELRGDQLHLTAFRFRITLADFQLPERQRASVHALRDIADSFATQDMKDAGTDVELEVTGYVFELTDQFDEIAPNTGRNVGIGLGCMVVVSLALIPNPICTLWITLAIVSIDAGVFGYMAMWDVNLDAISMVTIIMSIGFAVDFAAHVTYGYVSAAAPDPTDKVIQSLELLGWPVFQGAASTVLGIAVLGFIDSYLISVFFKTILLVVVFGCVHALLFLPLFLVTAMPLIERACGSAAKAHSLH